MAGAQKIFTMLFQLQASIGGNFNSSFSNAQNAARKLQSELAGINAIQNKIGGYQKQLKAIEANKNGLAALMQKQTQLKQAMSATEQPSKALQQAYERNARQIQQTTARIGEQQKHLNLLQTELQDAGVDTNRLTEENDRLSDSYKRIQQNQEKFAHLADAQQKNAAAISQTKAQLAGTIGTITAVGAAIYAGPVQQSMKFQSSMAKVGTIADAQKVPLHALQKDILNLSNDINVNANSIAEDVYNAISAGQKTEDAVGFVGKAVKLAKGGFAETGQALDVMTTILNAYGMESSKAGTVADMLIQTQNKGKVTVAELSSVMGKIIPTANANNVALEQLCAGYAIMTSKGIAAAETTTYMNSMLNELGKTGTKADKALKSAAGAGFQELMSQGKSLAEVLAILDQEAKNGGLSIADMFGSAEAGKAVLTLMSDGVEGFNAQVSGMVDSTGAAESAFQKMSETTEEKMAKAKNALNNLSIVLGDTFLPYVTSGAQKVAELVTKFSAWAQENPELLKTIVKIGAGIAALSIGGKAAKLGFLEIKGGILSVATVFAKLKAMGGIQGILGKMGGMKSIFGGIGGKLLPVIGIVTAIGAAIHLVSENIDAVRGFIQRTFGDTGLAVFDKVWGVISGLGNAIKSVFSDGNMSGVRDFFQNTFGEAGAAAFDAVASVVGELTAVLPGLLDQLGQIAATILPTIMSAGAAILPALMQIAKTVLPPLLSLLGQVIPFLAQIANTVLPIILQGIQAVVPLISQLIQTALPVLQQLLQELAPVIQILAEAFGNGLASAIDSAKAVIDGLTVVLQGILTFITGVFTGNWQQAWEGVKQIFSGVMDSLKAVVTAPINFIISAVNTLIGGLNKIKIPDWVPGLGGKGITIPQIPMLAKGSKSSPDTFIAGEQGPELITNSKGRTVFTAMQTGKILNNVNALQGTQNAGQPQNTAQQVIITLAPAFMAALSAMNTSNNTYKNREAFIPSQNTGYSTVGIQQAQPASLQIPSTQGGTVLHFESAPVFHVSGGNPEGIREMFQEYHDQTLRDMEEMMRQKELDERRRRYE